MTPYRQNLHHLALQLHMPVGVMLSSMSGQELADWFAFFEMQSAPKDVTSDWREMEARFKKIRELQGDAGKRVLVPRRR